jgi:hemerythrin
MWEVLSRNKQFREGDNQGPEKFVNFLSEWIHSHIKGADKIFADFFLNMKHHGKLRLTLSDVPQLKASAV